LSHSNPSGDLAALVERAVDLLLRDLEKKRLGKADRPRRPGSTKRAAVTRAVRREVFARDGLQCTFRDQSGRRCQARAFLELDHVRAQALGGNGESRNVRVLCKAHNRLHAEQTFGRQHVQGRIHLRQKKCTPQVLPVAQSALSDGKGTLELPAQPQAALNNTHNKLLGALRNLGFKPPETRQALRQIGDGKSRVPPTAPIEELLREAVVLLTRDVRRSGPAKVLTGLSDGVT
jgi:hypothetical protein